MVNKDNNPENDALENMIKSLTKEYDRLQDMKLLRLEELWWILDNFNLQIILTQTTNFLCFSELFSDFARVVESE